MRRRQRQLWLFHDTCDPSYQDIATNIATTANRIIGIIGMVGMVVIGIVDMVGMVVIAIVIVIVVVTVSRRDPRPCCCMGCLHAFGQPFVGGRIADEVAVEEGGNEPLLEVVVVVVVWLWLWLLLLLLLWLFWL